MLSASRQTLSLSFLTAISTTLASSAPPSPNLLDLPTQTPSPTTNLTTTTTRCTIPAFPPYIPVSLAICQPTFSSLLNAPDVDVPRKYSRWKSKPVQLTGAPCAISVDSLFSEGKLTISKRHLVEGVRRILVQCAGFGQGGWATVEGSEGWIVIVQGVGDLAVEV